MIGDLRTRVGIYVPQETIDDLGGTQIQWQFSRALWAHIVPRTHTQSRENGRLTVTQSYHVTLRFIDDFPERARIMWGHRILRIITSSDPDNRRERLHLMCEEEQQ